MIEEFIEIPNEGLVFRIVVGPVETLLGWHGVESGEVLLHVVHLVGILIVVFVVHGDLVLGAGLKVWKETLKLRCVLQIIVQSVSSPRQNDPVEFHEFTAAKEEAEEEDDQLEQCDGEGRVL